MSQTNDDRKLKVGRYRTMSKPELEQSSKPYHRRSMNNLITNPGEKKHCDKEKVHERYRKMSHRYTKATHLSNRVYDIYGINNAYRSSSKI